jgi:hypothetical protein
LTTHALVSNPGTKSRTVGMSDNASERVIVKAYEQSRARGFRGQRVKRRRAGLADVLQLVGQLRLARIKAITTVSHCSVSFTSTTQLKVYPMTYDGTKWQLASTPINTVTLPAAVSFPSALVGTRIEFNSRGMVANSSALTQINLNDTFGQTRSVQAWPSGQVYAL